MSLIETRTLQKFLKLSGAYAGEIDGDWGPQSKAAARKTAQVGSKHAITDWSDSRVRLAVEQMFLRSQGLSVGHIDGLSGVQTQVALEKWQDMSAFSNAAMVHVVTPRSKQTQWPRQSFAELVKFYGQPGTNQVMLTTPYPLFLDWELSTKIQRFSCHKLVAESVERAMVKILEIYGLARIHELGLDQFGGCLNVRKMRNGSSWSTHAWGIAIDWDADRNTLRETSKTARLARPEYNAFLDAWEAEGWVSLGRERNYDWMHVQAARL